MPPQVVEKVSNKHLSSLIATLTQFEHMVAAYALTIILPNILFTASIKIVTSICKKLFILEYKFYPALCNVCDE